MLSAKQQPSNIKHGGAIRPNVCKLTFGPLIMSLLSSLVPISFSNHQGLGGVVA